MSSRPCCRLSNAYLIHASNKGIVGRGIILRRDENAVTLCWSDVDQFCFGSLGVDAVHFDYSHSVTFEPEVLTGEGAYVDDTEHISLPRLDWRCKVEGIVHEGRIRYWLGSCWIGHADETLHELRYLVVIPV